MYLKEREKFEMADDRRKQFYKYWEVINLNGGHIPNEEVDESNPPIKPISIYNPVGTEAHPSHKPVKHIIEMQEWEHNCGPDSGCDCYDYGTRLIVNGVTVSDYFGNGGNIDADLTEMFKVLNINVEIKRWRT